MRTNSQSLQYIEALKNNSTEKAVFSLIGDTTCSVRIMEHNRELTLSLIADCFDKDFILSSSIHIN